MRSTINPFDRTMCTAAELWPMLPGTRRGARFAAQPYSSLFCLHRPDGEVPKGGAAHAAVIGHLAPVQPPALALLRVDGRRGDSTMLRTMVIAAAVTSALVAAALSPTIAIARGGHGGGGHGGSRGRARLPWRLPRRRPRPWRFPQRCSLRSRRPLPSCRAFPPRLSGLGRVCLLR